MLSSLHTIMLSPPFRPQASVDLRSMYVTMAFRSNLSSFTISVQSKRGKSFQQAFVQLRVEFLESMIRLQGCLRELPLSAFSRPSPQEIEAGSQHLVSKQLVQCSQLLRATALGYAHLARCHFDIDELSLATLQAYARRLNPTYNL